jgi:hypothetical protein
VSENHASNPAPPGYGSRQQLHLFQASPTQFQAHADTLRNPSLDSALEHIRIF